MDFLATPRRRRVLFTALYVSEGAPIGFLWWALPTWLRARDVPLASITALTALLVLPWTLKFLWAPLVDVLRSGRWSYRRWIIAAQVLMGLTLLPLFALDWEQDFRWVVALLLAHAFAAATQDVAVDALSISVLSPDERGRTNGWMQAGMLLGRSALGGGALVLADHWGRSAVLVLLLAAIWSSLLLVIGSREPDETRPATDERTAFGRALWRMLGRRETWLGLAFALTAGAAFEAVGSVAGPLLVDRGYAPDDVGRILAVPVVLATVLGALSGGVLADRWGHRTAVVLAQLVIVSAVVPLSLVAPESRVALAGPLVNAVPAGVLLLVVMYFGIGAFTAASYALLMDLTHPALRATQFSAFMGATNGCEAWAAFTVGRVVQLDPADWFGPSAAPLRGYGFAFLIMAAVSTAALLILPLLPRERQDH